MRAKKMKRKLRKFSIQFGDTKRWQTFIQISFSPSVLKFATKIFKESVSIFKALHNCSASERDKYSNDKKFIKKLYCEKN